MRNPAGRRCLVLIHRAFSAEGAAAGRPSESAAVFMAGEGRRGGCRRGHRPPRWGLLTAPLGAQDFAQTEHEDAKMAGSWSSKRAYALFKFPRVCDFRRTQRSVESRPANSQSHSRLAIPLSWRRYSSVTVDSALRLRKALIAQLGHPLTVGVPTSLRDFAYTTI